MLPPLQTAARSGDVEELRALLLNGVSPHSTDSIGATALHWACHGPRKAGQIDCLKLLVEHGASVNARDTLGNTPLHFCVMLDGGTLPADNAAIMSLLIEAGADVRARTDRGREALHMAARFGAVECTVALLKAGASVNARSNVGPGYAHPGTTPLEFAAADKSNHTNTAPCLHRVWPILLRAGADLPAEADDPYLQKVIDAGGWANYERRHRDKLTAMLTPKDHTDERRRSRRRLSPLRRLPPEVLRRIVAYAFHAGYY